MLDGLRNFARTWPGKILGGFVLIGLAGFGISGVLTGSSFNTIAKVGDEEISTVQFQRNYNIQLNNMAEQVGSTPTSEQAIALGIPSQVINQLAIDASLNGLAKDFQLGVSDERLGTLVRQDPSFSGTLGNFEPENFRSVLQRSGWTEKEYFDLQRKSSQRQQLSIGLFAGFKAPNAVSALVDGYGSDTRDIEYFIVSDKNMLPPSDPTQAEIAQYLSDNQSAFRTQTLREVKIMSLTPAIIAKNLQLSEQEIIAEYERTKANYIKIETRNIEQIILNSDAALKRFELGIELGDSFEELASQTGLEISDLGAMTKEQILDGVLSETAFSLNEGEFKIISGISGKRAIHVSKINTGGQTPLAELHEQISDRLKNKHARELYIDMLDNIEEQRAAFKPIEEIAKQFKLELRTALVSQNGEGLDAISGVGQESYEKISNAIFAAKEEGLTPSISLGSNMNLWFDLVSIREARDQTIAEVGDAIKTLILEQKTVVELANKVNKIVKSINDIDDFATVAVSSQSIISQSNGLTRASSSPKLSQQVVFEVFNGGKNHTGSAVNENGDYVIFKVVDVNSSKETNEQVNEYIQNSIIDSVFAGFATGLLEDDGLRINQKTLSQVLNPPTYGGYN